MTYQVVILPSAQRELGRLPFKDRQRVDQRMQSLADPRPPGVVEMKGRRRGFLRLLYT